MGAEGSESNFQHAMRLLGAECDEMREVMETLPGRDTR